MDEPATTSDPPTTLRPATRVEVLIIGTGFAGLAMAARLRKAGVEDFVLLERADEIGGTWRDNHYPGCACDVQSHLYSLSFAPNHAWTRAFAGHAEIQAYLLECFERFDLRAKVRLGAEVSRAVYDESSATWIVGARDGRRWRARVVVSAIGALSNPDIPELPGLAEFSGTTFHSAQWDHEHDLRGRNVAVIGTGASAIQFVPQIAPKVASLHLYQRTPPWILPKADRAFGRLERAAYAHVPGLQLLRRASLYCSLEARMLGFAHSATLMKAIQLRARLHIRSGIRDPELRALVTPDYTLGCKRILLSNDYYPALDRDNVEVVAGGAASVTPTGVVDARGRERPVDTIIFGTGFRVQSLVPPGMFVGRHGLDLTEAWRDRVHAYKGTTVPGFPNLFLLAGPNTGLGHSSMIYMIESQVAYVLDAVCKLRDRDWASVEVREPAATAFLDEVERRSQSAVWLSGCRSWYLDAAGQNTTLWPDFTFRFRRATARFDEQAYDIRTRAELTPHPTMEHHHEAV